MAVQPRIGFASLAALLLGFGSIHGAEMSPKVTPHEQATLSAEARSTLEALARAIRIPPAVRAPRVAPNLNVTSLPLASRLDPEAATVKPAAFVGEAPAEAPTVPRIELTTGNLPNRPATLEPAKLMPATPTPAIPTPAKIESRDESRKNPLRLGTPTDSKEMSTNPLR